MMRYLCIISTYCVLALLLTVTVLAEANDNHHYYIERSRIITIEQLHPQPLPQQDRIQELNTMHRESMRRLQNERTQQKLDAIIHELRTK